MIIFKELKLKNFMSYGNDGVEFDLNASDLILLVGQNGRGKSVLVDAFSYCCFGRPYRKIKIGDVVNRINGKRTLVELTFSKGDKEYTISRGLKPAVFIIRENGNELPMGNASDMQEHLERNILGFDEKTFKQMVLLGSGYHTPYMKLPLSDRRMLIETLFDLDILRQMRGIIKEKQGTQKEVLTKYVHEHDIIVARIEQLKNEIARAKERHASELQNRKTKIAEVEKEKTELESRLVLIQKQIADLTAEEIMLESKHQELIAEESKYKEELSRFKLTEMEMINRLNEEKMQSTNEKTEKLQTLQAELFEKQNTIRAIQTKTEKDVSILDAEYTTKRNDIHQNMTAWRKEVEGLEKRISFYDDRNKCEVCGSDLAPSFVAGIVDPMKANVQEMTTAIDLYEKQLFQIKNDFEAAKNEVKKGEQEKVQAVEDKVSGLTQEIGTLKNELKRIDVEFEEQKRRLIQEHSERKPVFVHSEDLKSVEQQKTALKIKINGARSEEQTFQNKASELAGVIHSLSISIMDLDLSKVEDELQKQRTSLTENDTKKESVETVIRYLDLCMKLLADGGMVKKTIIAKYLPLLNRKLNEYLALFDAEYTIKIDNEFDASISIRGEGIDYESFSGGERQRIDLAMLFTFMSFSELKANISTNLMIFDEVLDSSLDEQGVDTLFSVLKQKASTGHTIYIISHRPTNYDRFDKVFEITKQQFSSIRRI